MKASAVTIQTIKTDAVLLKQLHDKMVTAIVDYNEKLSETLDVVQAQAEAWEGEYEDKSEGWQNSDRGEAASELIQQWNDFSYDEVEIPEDEVVEALLALEMETS